MFCCIALTGGPLLGQVAVRQTQGSLHGFLVLRTLQGETLASGDLAQSVHGSSITSRLTFDFKDGSSYDETSTYTQHRTFRLLRHHLVVKGPSFAHPLELTTDVGRGIVTVHYTDDGKPQEKTEHMKLPANLADGMITTVLENIAPQGKGTKLGMVVATPKPRLVSLAVSNAGQDEFTLGGAKRQATHFVLKVELGGIAGAVAPLVGKQPADIHVWITRDEVPTFVRWQGPLVPEGPVWVIELTSPVWPKAEQEKK